MQTYIYSSPHHQPQMEFDSYYAEKESCASTISYSANVNARRLSPYSPEHQDHIQPHQQRHHHNNNNHYHQTYQHPSYDHHNIRDNTMPSNKLNSLPPSPSLSSPSPGSSITDSTYSPSPKLVHTNSIPQITRHSDIYHPLPPRQLHPQQNPFSASGTKRSISHSGSISYRSRTRTPSVPPSASTNFFDGYKFKINDDGDDDDDDDDDNMQLKNHKGSEIEPEEHHPCTEPGCNADLWSRQSLIAHLQSCTHKVSKSRTSLSPSPKKEDEEDLAISSLSTSQSNHKASRGPGAKKYPCSWINCDKILATPKSLKDHMQIHSERSQGYRLKCPITGCNKIFGTYRCLRAHELRCKQVKSGKRLKCSYPDCNATFGSSDYVRRHILDHEKGLVGIQFKCQYPDCNAVLANSLTLQRHQQLHEEQALGFDWKCLVPNCNKIYSGSKQLTDHQSRLHKNLSSDYRFSCPFNTCDEQFACQRAAYKHDCTVLPAAPPTTTTSSSTAISSSSSTATTDLNKQLKCTIEGCEILLPNERVYDLHVFMHSTIRSRGPYPCFEEQCSMSFMKKEEALVHAITHCK